MLTIRQSLTLSDMGKRQRPPARAFKRKLSDLVKVAIDYEELQDKRDAVL